MMRGNTLAAVVANRHDEELSQLEDIERIYFSSRAHAGGIFRSPRLLRFLRFLPGPAEEGDGS